MTNIRLIAADDHEVYLDGLELLLQQHPYFELVGRAATGQDFLELCALHNPDMVLIDLRMPGMSGIEAYRQMAALPKPPAGIIVSMFDDQHLVREALEEGIKGYVAKGAKKEEILQAIDAVANGQVYFSHALSNKMLQYFFAPQGEAPVPVLPELTAEEKEIVRLVCDGLTSKEIGETLFRGKRTIELSRRRIAEKIGAKTGVEWVKAAVKLGLYQLV